MLLVVLEYFSFVAVSMFGNIPAPKNVSICGFLELVPNWVFFLYAHVAAAGVDCTVFAALAIFRKETAESGNKGIGVARGLLMLLCAVCLAGFSAVPRCLWDVHQNLVLCWVVATSAAMFLSLLRERSCEGYSVFPLFLCHVGPSRASRSTTKAPCGFTSQKRRRWWRTCCGAAICTACSIEKRFRWRAFCV